MNPNQKTAAHPSPTPGLPLPRRQFLTAGALALGSLAVRGGSRLAATEDDVPAAFLTTKDSPLPGFKVEPLGYAYNALEPFIDGRTMEIHHDRHYRGYVTQLNRGLAETGFDFLRPLGDLLAGLAQAPDSLHTLIRNQGGGAANHEHFWSILSPHGGGVPQGQVGLAIAQAFGDFPRFQEAFSRQAANVFGSGWAWLCLDREGGLFVTSTPNQDNPLMKGVVERPGIPILGLDLWEHAYYLHYQNRRADYVRAWWNVVDWEAVNTLYLAATH